MSLTFEQQLYLSSVPLVRIGEHALPDGIASGCLVDHQGKRILLTVSHATGDNKNWAIQLRYVPTKGTELYQLGAMMFLAKGTMQSEKLEDVDFSYIKVPPMTLAYRQEIDLPSNKIKSERPITVHKTPFGVAPSSDQNFGFCGLVMPTHESHFGKTYFGGELKVYQGLEYLRAEDDYFVFKLPFKHPGHKHFQGCSGAPILNSDGQPVALVCCGNESNDEIWGISLEKFKVAIDILAQEVEA